MKIAILGTRGIPARYGGFETFAERLATGLSENDFDVTVFCEHHNIAPDLFGRVRLRYVSAPPLGVLQTILFDLRCLWLARKSYDIVYMLGYGAAPFCVIPRMWGTRLWINPDGLEWARAKWGFVARVYFRLMEWITVRVANCVVADAHAIVKSLEERHGRISACAVIPYGCEVINVPPPLDVLSAWDVKPGDYFIVVCRLEPENHVAEILRAFHQSASKRQLIVVGNIQSRTKYVTDLLSIRDSRIKMIGTIYDQTVLTALRYHAFGYLHGHSVGGTNPSLLEAMGCGNLIFAHDNMFNRETLGDCGCFFASSQELIETINRTEHDHQGWESLRECAKRRARAQYHWPDIIARYISLIRTSELRQI